MVALFSVAAPEWLSQLWHILWRSWQTLWSWSGLGWAAVGVTAINFLYAIGERAISAYRRRYTSSSWRGAVNEVQHALGPSIKSRSTWVAIAAWALFFGVALTVTVHRDHRELVAANKELKKDMKDLESDRNTWKQKANAIPVSPIFAEPKNSLRRRIIGLVAEVKNFLEERARNRPPYGNGKSDAIGEQKRINEESERYGTETNNACLSRFEDRTRVIIQELKAAGVDLGPGPESGYFEAIVQQHRCIGEQDGWLLTKFRNLAYFVDGNGKFVVF
jgi:hypothetical protein